MTTIAVIGGTGALGDGLARRWAAAGFAVIIGSRSAARAEAAAREIGPPARGTTNRAAAAAADIVVLAVPFASHAAILEDIKDNVAGKIVVDTTVPLMPPRVAVVQMPPEGAAAIIAQRILGSDVQVVSALQNVSAHKLAGDGPIDCDILVTGDSREARATVIDLLEALGLRALHAGPIANSLAVEALTSILIAINRRYKADGAGIRITGLDDG